MKEVREEGERKKKGREGEVKRERERGRVISWMGWYMMQWYHMLSVYHGYVSENTED